MIRMDGHGHDADADTHRGTLVRRHSICSTTGSASVTKPASSDNRWIKINFYFDGLTGVMLLYVTVVSLMVVIYSIGYMRDHHGHPEVGYERFFAFLGLFVFSMCMLVLAGNFVLLYLELGGGRPVQLFADRLLL